MANRTHKVIRSFKRFLAGLLVIIGVTLVIYVAITDFSEILLAIVFVIPVGAITYFILFGIFNFPFIKERIISEIPQELYEAGYAKIISYEEYKEEPTVFTPMPTEERCVRRESTPPICCFCCFVSIFWQLTLPSCV